MSSLNDGSGPPTSQNDSIPLDDEGSSLSIYSGEEGEGPYEQSDELSDAGHSSVNYSSVSRTYLSQSQARGAAPQSEDYTGTASYYSNGRGGGGSNSYGYDNEDYEYSSGYDSVTYGDTSLRSPHSELSSTFASFYYENDLVVKVRSTLHFLRRPLCYFAFATAGSGAVSSVFRLATTMAKRHLDGGNFGEKDVSSFETVAGNAETSLKSLSAGLAELPSGYPDVPAWLQEVRASLPRVMEVPATWLLQRHNIPVLSDLVSEQQQLAQQKPFLSASSGVAAPTTTAAPSSGLDSHVSSGVQEAWQSWQKTGPAIPVALFLPLFSIVAIKVAQHIRPNTHSVARLLRAQQEAEDAEIASAYLSTTLPARAMSVRASPIVATGSSSGGERNAPPATAGNTSALSTTGDTPPTSRRNTAAIVAAAGAAPPQVPPVNIAGASADVAAPEARQPLTGVGSGAVVQGISLTVADGIVGETRESSRSTTRTPQTHRHIAVGELRGDVVEDIDVDTGARVVSPFTSANAEEAKEGGERYDPAAKPPSPLPQPPILAVASAAPSSVVGSAVTTSTGAQGRTTGLARVSTLRGDVVVAVAGTPDVQEANVALLAAARYGCSAVLLPTSLEHTVGLLEAPPSLDVLFVNDVVVFAMDLADRRGLTLLGVTAQQWDAQALPLDTFVHPVNSLYLFVSHEADNPAAVAAMEEVALQSVFVGTTRSELPANQVFYDRLQKERAAR